MTFQPSAHGDTPPPLRHADVLNGWSQSDRFLGRIPGKKACIKIIANGQGDKTLEEPEVQIRFENKPDVKIQFENNPDVKIRFDNKPEVQIQFENKQTNCVQKHQKIKGKKTK